MATHKAKKPRKGSRLTLQLSFTDEAADAAYRVTAVKEALTNQGSVALDTVGLLTTTLGCYILLMSTLYPPQVQPLDLLLLDQAWSDLCTRLVQPCVC